MKTTRSLSESYILHSDLHSFSDYHVHFLPMLIICFKNTLKYYIHSFTTVASDQKLGNRKESAFSIRTILVVLPELTHNHLPDCHGQMWNCIMPQQFV